MKFTHAGYFSISGLGEFDEKKKNPRILHGESLMTEASIRHNDPNDQSIKMIQQRLI